MSWSKLPADGMEEMVLEEQRKKVPHAQRMGHGRKGLKNVPVSTSLGHYKKAPSDLQDAIQKHRRHSSPKETQVLFKR